MTIDESCGLDTVIEAYKWHQKRVKGLREETVRGYERLLRRFLRASLGDDPIDTRDLRPSSVIEFVNSMRSQFSAHSMKGVRMALRSFLSFLRMEGLSDRRLEATIFAAARRRLSTLPRCLTDEQLKRVRGNVSLYKARILSEGVSVAGHHEETNLADHTT